MKYFSLKKYEKSCLTTLGNLEMDLSTHLDVLDQWNIGDSLFIKVDIIDSKDNKINSITFSGFDENNPLSKLGNVNFHIKSNEYNYIEMCHHIILVSIVDIFVKKLF